MKTRLAGAGLRFPSPRQALWLWYLLGGIALVLLYAGVPPFEGSGPLNNAIGLSSSIAILIGLRIHKPSTAAPWLLFVIGQFLFFLGDLYTYSYPQLFNVDVPFPSPGDGLYLSVYPALMAGLLVLVRRRNPRGDRAGVIDSLILTLGVALVSWAFIIAPYLHIDGSVLSDVGKGFSIAYPLGDILLLAAAIRLAVDRGMRAPAFYLLVGSIVCLLATDSAYTYMLLKETYNHQVILDMGWMLYYLLWGASALHPSMRVLEQPTELRTRLTGLRLGLLTVACLVAPSIRMWQQWGNYDVLVVVAGSAVLFLLVLLRMVGLVRQEERVTNRESALRSAGVELVGAVGIEQIERAAEDAVKELTGAQARAVVVRFGDGGRIATNVGSVGRLPSGARRWLSAACAGTGSDPHWLSIPDEAAHQLQLDSDTSRALVVPLTGRTSGTSFLVVAVDIAPADDVDQALETLAAQVSLAIDGAMLAEDLHRRRSEARFRSLIAHSSDLVTVLDRRGHIVYQSPAIERALGLPVEDVLERPFAALVHPADQERFRQVVDCENAPEGETGVIEAGLRSRSGEWLQFEIRHTNLLHEEHVQGVVLNCRDISERKKFEQQLAHQAFHDPVTNLANRALFADRVQHALARAEREGSNIAVVFIDLDDFKTINDSLGHAAGDVVLREIAARLEKTLRPTDTAARFGGDEFAVLLEEITGSQAAVDVAERILDSLNRPIDTGDKELVVGASVGLCLTTDASRPDLADELLRNADVAMYMAKREEKGSYRIFEPAMHAEVVERLEMRSDLQTAIESGQFEVHYQPVIRLNHSTVYGFEALLRWHHPSKGDIPPVQFIPVAEDTGLIIPIGRWVLREACVQAARLNTVFPGAPELTISVNLSVKQLQSDSIVADVRDALQTSGLSPQSLVLEITESVVMADTDLAVQRLRDLKALGVRLAMDDFGTGYSSLSYLSRFPVDILKMDRSFLEAGGSDNGLAAAIVALGDTLDLEVVAEGIEQQDQASSLQALGCDLGQGFLFARAMSSPALMEYLIKRGEWPDESTRSNAA
jgi:diguanylate cyclase (GGDEF)-like protein/PAS domain S-box-containing protein